MHKIGIFTAALILIGVGAWITTTAPRVEASTTEAVFPLALMSNAKNLPEPQYHDYTFVFTSP